MEQVIDADNCLAFLSKPDLMTESDERILHAIHLASNLASVSHEQAYAIWSAAENTQKDFSSPQSSFVHSTRLKQLALDLLTRGQEDADEEGTKKNHPSAHEGEKKMVPQQNSILHSKFVMDAHLKLASECPSQEATMHLEKAKQCFDRIALTAGEKNVSSKKLMELKFQLLLSSSHIWFDVLQLRDRAYDCAVEAANILNQMGNVGGVGGASCDLGIFAYNCGVREHRAKHIAGAIRWAQLSVDSFDRFKSTSQLCRSLRLLTACHLDVHDTESAKKACMLAMEIDATATSLAMLCRVHLASADQSALEASITRLLQAPDLTLQGAVELCEEMRRNGNHNALALHFLKQVELRFSTDPSLGLARLEHLRLSLNDANALRLCESIVNDHHAGTVRLSNAVCADMMRECFTQGVRESKTDSSNAISWIQYALILTPKSTANKEDMDARAQLHRLLCHLHLQRDDIVSALTHAKEAVALNPLQSVSHYYMARCYLQQGDVPATLQSLDNLASAKDFSSAAIYNLASIAQAQGIPSVMVDALEKYIGHVTDPLAQRDQLVTAIRALLRGLAGMTNYEVMVRVIQLVVRKAEEAGGWNALYPREGANTEGEWFAKFTYNAAASAMSQSKITASKLFHLAASLCSQNAACASLVLPSQKLALICFLDSSTDSPTPEQLNHAVQTMTVLRNSLETDELILLEFRLSLLQPNTTCADAIAGLNRAASLSSSPFLFERLASACLAQKGGLGEAAVRALTLSFRFHQASRPNMNIERCSTVVRSLLTLQLLTGDADEQIHYTQLKEIIDLVKSEHNWPLHERQWLTTIVWNTGSREMRRKRLPQAEQWCGLAMGLLKFCGQSWPQATQMKDAYQQILARIGSIKI